VRSDVVSAQGNNLFYNVPLPVLLPNAGPALNFNTNGFLQFGQIQKGNSARISLNAIQDEINYYRRTHPQLTQADRDHLNDLALQRDAAQNQVERRLAYAESPIPRVGATGGPIGAYFNRRSDDDSAILAQNSLYDARQTYNTDPSQANLIPIRDAQDNIEQADDRADADTYDLLGGSFGDAQRLGPIFRKKASQTKLQTGYRDLRAAQKAFTADPSEDNRDTLRLANLFIDATQHEDTANNAEIVTGTFAPVNGKISMATEIGGLIENGQAFQDCAQAWLKYDRLKRKILKKKEAQANQKAATAAQQTATDAGASPVAQQLLGLSMYGSSAAPGAAGGGTPAVGQ